MSNKPRWLFCISLSLILSFVLNISARANTDPVELITNGNFATGTLAGWIEADQAGGSGSWFVSSSTTSPLSLNTTPGPFPGDSSYAVTDQIGPGSHVLLQNFTVPIDTTSLLLTFHMFSDDRDSGPFCPRPLDYTISPNQCARVDILTGAAGAFDTGAGVVTNLYKTATLAGGANPTNPWVPHSFDLTGLTPGDSYQLRFGEVDTQLFFQQGVDDVRLLATFNTPEPSSLLLFCTGLLSVAIVSSLRLRLQA